MQVLLILPLQGKNPSTTTKSLQLKTLLNCTYYVDDFWETVTLHGGQFKRREGGFDCTLTLTGQSWGDLDRDGQIDALVILASGGCGGNSTEYYLIPVLNRDGKPKVLKPVDLGYGIIIKSLNVKTGIVIGAFESSDINFNTIHYTKKFKLVSDHLESIE